jgi:hypothetical protein
MLSSECLLAAVLLTTPSDGTPSPEVHAWSEACRPALLALALDAEILDKRETPQFLVLAQDFTRDLRDLQGRFRDLAFAPLVEEAARFPDRHTINDFLAFNRGYRAELIARLEVDTIHAEQLRLAIAETDDLHHLWNAARDARCAYYYITVRRQALLLLRDLMGAEAFYAGVMPPYVPVWRIAVAK